MGASASGGAKPRRRILLVTYYWHPANVVALNRLDAFARYLSLAGHEVTVLTTTAHAARSSRSGTSVASGGRARVRVVRAFDAASSAFLRRLLGREPVPDEGGLAPDHHVPPPLVGSLFVPDPTVASWVPWALAAALRLARSVDVVVTSGPPESVHLIGKALRLMGVPWVADFRDPWVLEEDRARFRLVAQRKLDVLLERAVATGADRLVTATAPIAKDLADRYGVTATTVTNAWDPEFERLVANRSGVERRTDRRMLVHAGSLTARSGRSPRPLAAALAQLRDSHPDEYRKLDLVLAGPVSDAERAELGPFAGEGPVRFVGRLERGPVLALEREADGLLLLTSASPFEASGKIFEYLAAGRPILALADGNAAAAIVRETGTGVVVPLDDPARVAAALAAFVRGELDAAYAPRNLDRYRQPNPVHLLERLIEDAIASRARRGPRAAGPRPRAHRTGPRAVAG